MRHVSLYRKWRPRTFDAIVGQEPVVRTLRRAIETNRIAHAYLFSGPRGTGKTSTAKVLAMGLNCVKGPTPDPDGRCESCRTIINNSSMDVLEMDAASNRGIDEIRDLRDKVNLAPTQGRMKVYIVDEVHMLTTEAFNALLKILEEPPEHVIFILATTEKHKVLPTIISRCQSFDFRRPGVSILAEKLREIAEAEGIEAEPEALTVIAREGKGSFRDAEGLLDQLASFTEGPITALGVREFMGSVGSEVLLRTTEVLHERRAADALRIVDGLHNGGKDLSRFVGELVAHLRRLMLLPYSPEIALAEVGSEERAGLEEQAGRVPTAKVVRMIEALGEALSRVKRGVDVKLELELTFLKLTRDYTEPSVEDLISRIEALEMVIANDGTPELRIEREEPALHTSDDRGEEPQEEPEGDNGGEADRAPGQKPERPHGRESEESGTMGKPRFDLDWVSLLHELRRRRQVPAAAFYESARIASYDDGVLKIVFPKEMKALAKHAGDPRRLTPLQEVLEERLGERPRVEFGIADTDDQSGEPSETSGKTPSISRTETGIQSDTASEMDSEESRTGGHHQRTDSDPVSGNEPDTSSGITPDTRGGVNGADSTIQDPREVFIMARERFGSDGKEKRDG